MSTCRHFVPLLEPFRDGELSPAEVVDVETHLVECERCSERLRLAQAMRVSLKERRARRRAVTESFEERIRLALSAEREREERRDPAHDAQMRMLSWRSIVPIAAAAAVVMVWAASANNRHDGRRVGARQHVPVVLARQRREAAGRLGAATTSARRPQYTEQTLLAAARVRGGRAGASCPTSSSTARSWEGVSVVPVSNQRAASLRYRIAGHRLTVYVYDAARVPVRSMLQQRVVRDEPVYVGSRHGVSIAATERSNGVGYAVATDLNKDESAELVASIY